MLLEFRESSYVQSYNTHRCFAPPSRGTGDECEKIFREGDERNARSPLLIVNTTECGILFSPRQYFPAHARVLRLSSRYNFFPAPSVATVQRCAFTSRQFILTSTNATERDWAALVCYRQVSFPQKSNSKMKNRVSAELTCYFSESGRYVRNVSEIQCWDANYIARHMTRTMKDRNLRLKIREE